MGRGQARARERLGDEGRGPRGAKMEARRTEGERRRGAEGEGQAVDAGIELLGRESARAARETD